MSDLLLCIVILMLIVQYERLSRRVRLLEEMAELFLVVGKLVREKEGGR